MHSVYIVHYIGDTANSRPLLLGNTIDGINSIAQHNTKPKLAVLRLLKEKGSESRCLDMASKRVRRVMMRLRGGTAPLRIESGRWQRSPMEERTCQECQSGEVEDVAH